MVFGLNAVTRCLEKSSLRLVLVDMNTKPAVMTSHILDLALSHQCVCVGVPDLAGTLGPILNLSSLVAMGIKVSCRIYRAGKILRGFCIEDQFRRLFCDLYIICVDREPAFNKFYHFTLKKQLLSSPICKKSKMLVSLHMIILGHLLLFFFFQRMAEADDNTDKFAELIQALGEYSSKSDDPVDAETQVDSDSESPKSADPCGRDAEPLEESEPVDYERWYIYKKDLPSGSTFDGSDFLAFTKDSSDENDSIATGINRKRKFDSKNSSKKASKYHSAQVTRVEQNPNRVSGKKAKHKKYS